MPRSDSVPEDVAPLPRSDLERAGDGRPGVGFTLKDALGLSKMRRARVVAGADGLDRPVRWVHILDIPDIVPWVSANDLVLTNAYGFATNPESMDRLVERLDDKRVSGLMVGMGLFIQELPEAMLEEANARSFPVIEIPWKVRFEDLTLELIQGILGTQSALLERVQLASQGLLEGALSAGFDKMAERLADALAKPAVVLDRWGNAIAGSPTTFLSLARQHHDLIKQELDGFPRRSAEREDQGVDVRLGRRRVSLRPTFVGDRLVGAILLGSAKPLGPSDRMVMTVASIVVALELTRHLDSFQSAYARRQEFLTDLVRGSMSSLVNVEARAGFLGWSVGQPFVVAVLDVDEFADRFGELHEGEGVLEKARRDILDNASRHLPGPEVFVAEHSGSLTVLMEAGSTEEVAKLLEPLRAGLRRLFDGSDVTVGLAGPAESLREVQHLHGLAWEAIRIARKLGRSGDVVPFDELRVDHLLLRLEDRDSGALSLVPELRNVLDYDDRHQGGLFRTLETYLQAWGNVELLARELHIHRNTARYRIRKIEELLGRSLLDPDYRFALHIATKLVHLES
jgi:purine catabolism regulator